MTPPPDLPQLETKALDWAASILMGDAKSSTNLDKGAAAIVVAILKLAYRM